MSHLQIMTWLKYKLPVSMVLLLFPVGIGIARELGKYSRHNVLRIRGTDTKQMIDLCASHVYSDQVMEY